MKLKELTSAIEILETNADLETEVTGIKSVSTEVQQGDVFAAIEGYKTDGHKYIEDAAAHGASCIICRKEPAAKVQYIKVKDTRKAMSLMSARWFDNPAKKMKLIGVTGTNGKTTVTYLIKHILEQRGEKVGLIGTIENLIGNEASESKLTTPDCFELQQLLGTMAEKGCTGVVMEVSSHALYLNRVFGIEFEVGIFTNLTNDHLDFHPTLDDYADAKAMLFQNSRQSVINIDDKYAGKMIENARNVLTYGIENKKADLLAGDISLKADKTTVSIYSGGKKHQATINIPGMFSVYNALAAIGAAEKLAIGIDEASAALAGFKGVKGRAEVLQIDDDLDVDFTVIIDYAHTPDALENIIKTARTLTDGRVHTLFGCGGDRDKTKRPLMGRIATQLSDFVTITSDNPRTEDPDLIIKDILAGIPEARWDEEGSTESKQCVKEGLKVVTNRREAIREALDILLAGDILLIAGKGHEMYQILGNEKTHFDDREVVLEHLRKTAESKRRIHARG